ncbi:MAG: c-type cytochrome [Chloroflexi bacterium]|nr:c-type cytochrome [Chloroflexota bacterium]
MQLSAGALVLFVGMLVLLLALVAYASGVGRRSHEPIPEVPTGNPSMERKVVATLAMLILSGLLLTGYAYYEPIRQVKATERQDKIAIERGIETYTSLCYSCHGIDGQGAQVPPPNDSVVAPALNRADMHPKDAEGLKARYEYVVRTVHRGKGLVMPAWGREDGGQLLDEQIHEVAMLITRGDMVMHGTQTAWDVAREKSKEKIAHGSPEPTLPKVDDAGLSEDAKAGLAIFTGKAGCIGCHQIGSQGGVTGPALTTIATVAETRKPGTDAAAYIEESIRNPGAFVVQGYAAGLMPAFQGLLTDAEIKQVEAYLLTRK